MNLRNRLVRLEKTIKLLLYQTKQMMQEVTSCKRCCYSVL